MVEDALMDGMHSALRSYANSRAHDADVGTTPTSDQTVTDSGEVGFFLFLNVIRRVLSGQYTIR